MKTGQLTFDCDEYTVFDFETSGLSPWTGDEVVEIGAMKIVDGVLDETNFFHTLVNPKKPLSYEVIRIHGITNEMLHHAPSIQDVFFDFLTYLGDSWLVAQNAKFDMSFLMKYLAQFQIQKKFEVYDTISLSKRLFPQESGHNLDAIARRLNLQMSSGEKRHRSLGDVKLTAHAFLKMKKHLGSKLPSRERWPV